MANEYHLEIPAAEEQIRRLNFGDVVYLSGLVYTMRDMGHRRAVDMLARGASPYDVAKLLGDTVATVEKHYAPFVKELRDRARRFMENGEGLEKTHCTIITQSPTQTGQPN